MFRQFASLLFRILLFLTLPTIAFPMQSESSHLAPIQMSLPPSNPSLLHFDDILDWVEAIEYDEIDETYTPDQVEKITYFLSFLAWNGSSPNHPTQCLALEKDIQTLLRDSRGIQYTPYSFDESQIRLAKLEGTCSALLCKNWFHKQCHQIKQFVKKHKTAIIIGAAVVVAAVAVVAVVALASTTAASSAIAAVSGAAAECASEDQNHQSLHIHHQLSEQQFSEPVDTIETVEQVIPALITTTLAQTLEEKIIPVKETLTQDAILQNVSAPAESWAFAEKARELGACAAHEILDGLAILGSAGPELLAEIGDIGSRLLPSIPPPPTFGDQPCDPVKTYNELVQVLHEKIDDVFNTSQAEHYAADAQRMESVPNMTIGALPPPVLDWKQLAEAGKVLDRAGYTRAGRGLTKHGDRPITVFPKAYGNPSAVNAQGQAELERILNHPEKIVIRKVNEQYGEHIDIMTPKEGGARFSADGKQFIGFLQPPRQG